MPWTPLNFGKHDGKTLPQVLFRDPDYFFWGCETDYFRRHGPEVQAEALNLHAKATSIRIPQVGPERIVAEYRLFYSDGSSVGFELVPESRPRHEGSSRTIRSDHIDMSLPRRLKGYDKLGYRMFLRSLKYWLFGDADLRMTKGRCETFFDDEYNFLVGQTG